MVTVVLFMSKVDLLSDPLFFNMFYADRVPEVFCEQLNNFASCFIALKVIRNYGNEHFVLWLYKYMISFNHLNKLTK